MHVPFHPLIVHFPLVLAFILPVLILIFAFMIKINKMTPRGWLIIVGLQLLLTITGYVSLESGQNEEHTVGTVVMKEYIHAHEDASEIFVGSTVIALVVSIAAFFIRQEFQFTIKMGVAFISLISCFLGYRTGELGGELVYKYGAGSAYVKQIETEKKLIPSPEIKVEEPLPETNESLKKDEIDYGDDSSTTEEEPAKDED